MFKRLLILSLLFTSVSYGQMIPHCAPLPSDGDALVLGGKQPMLVMLENVSQNDIWLTHPVQNPSASAGWATRIKPQHFTALAVKTPDFILECIESKPGHEQQVACKGVIVACKMNKTTFPKAEPDSGTYWAAEDQTLSALTATLSGRGFSLPPLQETETQP